MPVTPEKWEISSVNENLTKKEIDQFVFWVARVLLFLGEKGPKNFIFNQDSADAKVSRAIGVVSETKRLHFETVVGGAGNRRALFVEENDPVGVRELVELSLDSSKEPFGQELPLAFINFLNQALDQV